ncbi:MAG: hypothetical protein HFE82_04755 [Erysipelotrichaceae bacterium]|nr:hypothetical protein [Erysipelotrichaceae bacterium]
MEMKVISELLKKQLKGKYLRYVGILMLCTLGTSILNILFPLSVVVNYTLWYPIYLLIMLSMIIIRNTVYFLFIKCVRNERFQTEDIRYSFRKSTLHIVSAVLFEILQLGLLLLAQFAATLMPLVTIFLTLLIQILFSSVSLFIAFAIYDGVKGAMNIVNNSFRLMLFKLRDIIYICAPFLIWLLIYQLLNQYLVSELLFKDATTIIELLKHALHSGAASYAYGYLALEAVHLLISCMILVPIYTYFANLYERDYVNFYPFTSVIQTNVIDIDYQKQNDNND